MKRILVVAVLVFFVGSIVGVASPYWHKNKLQKRLKTASVYGTKNSIGDTRKFLDKEMKLVGYSFTGEDFDIEKDQHKTVTVGITYTDEISIFGVALKDLKFKLESTSYEFKEVW